MKGLNRRAASSILKGQLAVTCLLAGHNSLVALFIPISRRLAQHLKLERPHAFSPRYRSYSSSLKVVPADFIVTQHPRYSDLNIRHATHILKWIDSRICQFHPIES
ncbi:hypothetical protein GYMLUDRAFT_465823 [Collybiopsis luxurians FD-317 M1]|uniref:Uncharacterized protein n=1 Tax=Collybiopsis luxurians FD-317 M1 TaxID=944289 RepID=A0A0D0C5D4_9AGAR|nr:hypothetical protein GYMLUDRAFT_465823 [Collybiopsis luxurians FD-317 M1]